MVVALAAVAEGAPRVQCTQVEGRKVMWQVTGCVGGSSGGIHAHKVGINVISPIKHHHCGNCMVRFSGFGHCLASGHGCGGFQWGWVKFTNGKSIVRWLGVHGG